MELLKKQTNKQTNKKKQNKKELWLINCQKVLTEKIIKQNGKKKVATKYWKILNSRNDDGDGKQPEKVTPNTKLA